MCATDEYAIIFFKSTCLNVVNDTYIMAITLITYIIGVKNTDASGNIGIENLKNPYPPNFNNTPANITDPAVGASTCASGNHVCTGIIGTFTANDAKNAIHNNICLFQFILKSVVNNICISVVPVSKYIVNIPIKKNTDPNNV